MANDNDEVAVIVGSGRKISATKAVRYNKYLTFLSSLGVLRFVNILIMALMIPKIEYFRRTSRQEDLGQNNRDFEAAMW